MASFYASPARFSYWLLCTRKHVWGHVSPKHMLTLQEEVLRWGIQGSTKTHAAFPYASPGDACTSQGQALHNLFCSPYGISRAPGVLSPKGPYSARKLKLTKKWLEWGTAPLVAATPVTPPKTRHFYPSLKLLKTHADVASFTTACNNQVNHQASRLG